MTGRITSLLCFHLTVTLISPSPLYPEVDQELRVGTDEVPLKVQEAAYINPFRRQRAPPSAASQEAMSLSVKDPGREDGEEEEDDEYEEPLSLEEIERLHGADRTQDHGAVRRCQGSLNSSSLYRVHGEQAGDEVNEMEFRSVGSYLCRYGYLLESGDIISAIKEFQKFVKLEPTGVLTKKTMDLIKLPRCGDSDKRSSKEDRRKKRWANSNRKWDEQTLKFYIARYTRDLPRKQQREEIRRAIRVWSEVAPIDFSMSRSYNPDVDIILSFQYYYHRDEFSFDGTGGELAHAFLPQEGVIHFDDSEYWTAAKDYGINLYTVAAHEFGHSLGLEHTSKRGALMSPFYDDFSVEKEINPDDIVSIQQLYGYRGVEVKYDCPQVVKWETAFTDSVSGLSFAFYGEQVWQFDNHGLSKGYPKLAVSHFQGLLSSHKIEASLAFKNGYSFLFSSDKYWKYNATSGQLQRGYPRPRARWGLPPEVVINDVIRWPRNNFVYFFSSAQYYRYNSATGRMDSGYPQPLYLWQGVPVNFDGAMTSMDGGYTFFFIYHYYFPFNNRKARVEQDQVQEIKYSFFLCEEQINDNGKKARFLKSKMAEIEENINDENWKRFEALEINFNSTTYYSRAGSGSLSVIVLTFTILILFMSQ